MTAQPHENQEPIADGNVVQSVTPEYKIGDKAWYADTQYKESRIPCPVCFGKLKIVVILGNDEKVETDCDYCKVGFDPPRGTILKHEWVSSPREVTISSKEVSETSFDREVKYRSYDRTLYSADLFNTKEQAQARVLEIIAEREEKEEERIEQGKGGKTRSYAWHIGYHRRKAEEARKEAEYHEKKIVSLKPGVKPPEILPSHNATNTAKANDVKPPKEAK